MAIVGMDGVIEYINQKAIETFGYQPADIPNMERWWVQAYPDENYRREVIAIWMGLVEQAIAAGRDIARRDYQVTCKDGAVKTVGIFGVPVPNKVFVMFDDVTERRRITAQLKASEASLRLVLETSLDISYRRNLKLDQYDYMSPAIEKSTGFTVEEFSGMSSATVFDRIHPDDRLLVQRRLEQSAAGAPVEAVCEYRFKGKDGAYRWFADSAVVIRDRDGTPLYYAGVSRDITARKNVEEALRVSEAKYRQLYESIMDAIVTVDMSGRILEFNPAYQTMVGYSADELRRLTYQDLTPAKWHEREAAIVREQLLPHNYSMVYEKEYQRKDGTIFPVELRTFVIRDDAGQPYAMWAIVRDITERKQTEAALRESEQNFRLLVENAPDAIFIQINKCFAYVNAATVRLLGATSKEQLLGQPILERVPPDSHALVEARIRRINEERKINPLAELKYIRFDGTTVEVEASAVPFSYRQEDGALVFVRDISVRKQMERQLQESAANVRAVLETSCDAAYRRNLKLDQYDYLSPAFENITGFTLEEFRMLPRATVLGRIHPDDRPVVYRRVEQLMAGEQVPSACEYRFMRKDGAYRWFADSVTVIKGHDGTPLYHSGIVRDITDVKILTETLRENGRRISALLNASTEPIRLVDRQGTILVINEAMAQQLGKPVADLIGQCGFNFMPVVLAQVRKPRLEQVFQTGQPLRFEDESDGHYFDNSLFPVLNAESHVTAVAIYSRDITARKRAEFALQQANAELENKVQERTVQLRTLAVDLTLAEQRERQRVASVLHDHLQQLLIAARYRAAALQQTRNKPKRQTAARVEDLIAQSIECSRTLSGELSPPILLTGGLLPALEWLGAWMENKHGLVVKYSSDVKVLPSSEGISVLLFQATRELLLNIVKHAGVKSASVEVRQIDNHISVTVTDKGVGFDPAQLRPRADKISGLGLLSIRDRLELLGGHLEIASAPGAGSRFTLTAPVHWMATGQDVSAPPVLPQLKAASMEPAAKGQTHKIRLLVVDDHNVVRQALVQLLGQARDIEVVGEAENGQEAVNRARQLQPDVVTMDVSMKGMSGVEATRIIHAELPQVRVIGLSMFEEGELANAMLQAGAVSYLTKSSPADILIATIRAAGEGVQS